MELTPRLQTIADQVPPNARLADVGTDHGYLPVWLLLNGRIQSAIASDLRGGPLDRARQTARRLGQSDRISFRLCGGLSNIEEHEIDVIVIAGMGGKTIASILETASWTKHGKLLLLQPMTGLPELRQWLQLSGYAITEEQIAREGKRLYSIWVVRGGSTAPFTPAELWAGRQNNHPLRKEYLSLIIGKTEKLLNGYQAAREPDLTTIAKLVEILTGLRQMEEELHQ